MKKIFGDKQIFLYFVFIFFSNIKISSNFVSIILSNKGLALSSISLFFMVKQIMKLVLEIPTGFLADKYGRKINGFVGNIFFALSTICLFFNSYYVLLLSFVFLGIGQTLLSGSIESIIVDRVDSKKLDLINMIERLIMFIALSLGAIIGGLILNNYGYFYLLVTDILLYMIICITIILIKEKRLELSLVKSVTIKESISLFSKIRLY